VGKNQTILDKVLNQKFLQMQPELLLNYN